MVNFCVEHDDWKNTENFQYRWRTEPRSGGFFVNENSRTPSLVTTNMPPGRYTVVADIFEVKPSGSAGVRSHLSPSPPSGFIFFGRGEVSFPLDIAPRPFLKGDVIPVSLQRTAVPLTNDLPLWVVIKKSTDALSFENYNRFMDIVLCGKPLRDGENGSITDGRNTFKALKGNRFLPYNDVEAYRLLKAATEAFVMVNCGVDLQNFNFNFDLKDVSSRVGVNLNTNDLQTFWNEYLKDVNGDENATLPYLALIREKLKDSPIKQAIFNDSGLPASLPQDCFGIIREKLTNPCLLELIWSYWHEEGMLVQSMNSVAMRFQNIRANTNGRDPLANLEVDPLRPLNNLFWG
ncbi:MAG: hypothetical protein AAB354_12210, partial [candidate division KSB1 bacterium]